jgi:hypothetical protein
MYQRINLSNFFQRFIQTIFFHLNCPVSYFKIKKPDPIMDLVS